MLQAEALSERLAQAARGRLGGAFWPDDEASGILRRVMRRGFMAKEEEEKRRIMKRPEAR